jgi:hypothetical protein
LHIASVDIGVRIKIKMHTKDMWKNNDEAIKTNSMCVLYSLRLVV